MNDLAKDVDPPGDGRFLDGKSGWLKLAGAAALLYAAYLIGWSNAEPAQRIALPRHEIAAPPIERIVPPIPSPPPAGRGLSNDEVRELQAKLQSRGHDPGPVDGLFGPQTVGAVKRYELANELEPTGRIDLRLLERLRREP